MKCSKCASDQLFFAIGGDSVMVACKSCQHIEQKNLTPEIKAEIEKQMQGNVPWKQEGQ